MKQIVILAVMALTFNSCANLYTPSQQPVTFLEKSEGTALTGNLGHNGSTAVIGVGATKAIKKNLSVNVNGHLGLIPYQYAPGNPFPNSKKSNAFNVNIGWNTRKITTYPIQFWIGSQLGNVTDSYDLNQYIPNRITRDILIGTTVDSVLFEKTKCTYLGTRLGVSLVVLSNYDNDAEKKLSKKHKFDITHTATISPTRFNILNYDTVKTQTNVFMGGSTAIRYYTKNWMLSYNQELVLGGKNLFDDLLDRPEIRKHEMRNYATVIPYLSFTYFLK